MVAGGAPRDWDVGLPATDVDIWLTTRRETWDLISVLKNTFQYDTVIGDYKEGKFIHMVYNFYVGGVKLQLIFVKNSEPQEVIGRFCCTLSEAIWIPEKNEIIVSPEYIDSRANKEYDIHLDPNGYKSVSPDYRAKMRRKFPDYRENVIDGPF